MTGARCGNVTSMSTKQVSYVPVSHVWIAGVIAPLVVVVAAASLLVIYLLRRNGYACNPIYTAFQRNEAPNSGSNFVKS